MGTPARVRGGLIDKRNAILAAALEVFARDGYTRSSIESISTAAGVSTRTIYNHFGDKAELFRTTIHDSTTRVAEARLDIIDRHLGQLSDGADLEPVFVAFVTEWSTTVTEFSDHFALMLQLPAEAAHLPRSAVEDWLRTGPVRVLRVLAYHFQLLAARGLLQIDDSDAAAQHFSLLASAVVPPFYCDAAPSEEDTAKAVVASVRAFLYGYRR
ncbi:TetR/AcrR family transcriptional regulator [Nocardia sp. CNY236]|uniref:TetR/AcrR family transcriptional regulator n=1 Tax=Nocardia sp. CNY236 TaxID=1169152 RepID=UPI00040C92A6|nr:TetR/AcrR family transcriptional regulator [Nocardia sp. CNY236]